MGCLGVHFALSEDEVESLRAQPSDAARLEYLQQEIEMRYFGERHEWFAESDKAWDAIHRGLTDGTIAWDNGTFPLNHVILGGDVLYGREDYLMSLKTPPQVRAIADALRGLTADDFRKRYFAIDENECGYAIDREDFEYTWSRLERVRDLYDRAAEAGRYVLFTADQ